ncbi:MAG: protein kinase family protein [Chlamydia sp.]
MSSVTSTNYQSNVPHEFNIRYGSTVQRGSLSHHTVTTEPSQTTHHIATQKESKKSGFFSRLFRLTPSSKVPKSLPPMDKELLGRSLEKIYIAQVKRPNVDDASHLETSISSSKEKTDCLYNSFLKQQKKLSKIANKLNKGQSTTLKDKSMISEIFQVIQTSSGETDIFIQSADISEDAFKTETKAQSLGRGAFKTASLAVSLLTGLTHVLLEPNMQNRAKESLEKEYELSIYFKKNGISSVLELHKIESKETKKPYFFTEYCDKGGLELFIKDRDKLPFDKLLQLFVDVSAGLEEIHDLGVCHLDLKLNNIWVKSTDSGDLKAKIGDFGEAAKHNSKNTHPCGNDEYRAPEMETSSVYTKAMDVYSFGKMLFSLHLPYTKNQQYADLPPESPYRKLYDLAARCHKTHPTDRPTMREIHLELKNILLSIH